MPAKPPSEKQLAFAEKLARDASIDLPDNVREDMKACSAFIDAQMGKSKGRGGTRGDGKRRGSGGWAGGHSSVPRPRPRGAA